MDIFNILLVGGGESVKEALNDAFVGWDVEIDIKIAENPDAALEYLVCDFHGVCVVRSQADELSVGLNFTRDVHEAGLKTPIIVLMDLVSRSNEDNFIGAGAMAAIPWDGSQYAMLRNVVRLALKTRRTEEKLRESNDKLIQDLVTVQDLQERTEEQNVQYIELAEEYAIAKQELEVLNQEKNKFFTIIAHDLRSPFTTLLGYTGMLEQMADQFSMDQIKDYSAKIHGSASKVHRLLENLLNWAALQMDKTEPNPELFEIQKIADRTVEALGEVADKKEIAINNQINGATAYADPDMVDTIIRNLTSNALKFTNQGGTVTISAEQEDGISMVQVADTGIGMEAETLPRLFDIADNHSTKGTNGEAGTGLGLILCKELVEKNGGRIGVSSTPGEGTTFSFTLPSTKMPN